MVDAWPPTNRAQLDTAITNGLLVESHFVDLKRELSAAPKNRNIAIDLAAFSIDGGIIAVGVDESTSPVSIRPATLSGVAERIEQIGLSTVDPPVRVRTHAIEIGPGTGVLVVIIPPSPLAPHMVDHQYRARGDKTNYVMSDAEVWRVRDELREHEAEINQLLEGFARSVMPSMGNGPFLFMMARPVSGRSDMLLTCAGSNPFDWITRELLSGPLSQSLSTRWAPDFLDGLPVEPRADGWAITRQEISTLDIEIKEDGTLRLRAGELDVPLISAPTSVNDIAINGLVKRVVMTAGAISRACSHFGSWDFAVTLHPLRGRRSWMAPVGRESQMARGVFMPISWSVHAYHASLLRGGLSPVGHGDIRRNHGRSGRTCVVIARS